MEANDCSYVHVANPREVSPKRLLICLDADVYLHILSPLHVYVHVLCIESTCAHASFRIPSPEATAESTALPLKEETQVFKGREWGPKAGNPKKTVGMYWEYKE